MKTRLMQNSAERQMELDNCNFAKTVLMVIVVLYHSCLFWRGEWFTNNPVYSSNILSQFAEWMGYIHIYAFTLISGYIFYAIRCERGGYKDFRAFIKNKSKRLLVPYCFVAIIWVAPITALFLNYDVSQLIRNYFLGVAPGQLWFLIMLFGEFLLFWLLTNFFKKHNIAGLFAVLVLYGVGRLGIGLNLYQVWQICIYAIFFWIGFKIRQYGSDLVRRINIWVWLTSDIALYVLLKMIYKIELDSSMSNISGEGTISIIIRFSGVLLEFLLKVWGSISAFVILQYVAKKVNWNNSRYFKYVKKYSMAIYLFHQQIIYFSIACLNGIVNPYINVIVNFVIAMIGSLLISSVLLKSKATRFFIGEK